MNGFDQIYWLFALLGLLLSLWAQFKLRMALVRSVLELLYLLSLARDNRR